jgi:hypothetical protein
MIWGERQGPPRGGEIIRRTHFANRVKKERTFFCLFQPPPIFAPPTVARATPSFAMKRPRDASAASVKRSQPDLRHDPADDCETPLEAYTHVAPILRKIAQRKKIATHDLCLWDPYFCQGAAQLRLRSLGFKRARNEDVDFYSLINGGNGGTHGGEGYSTVTPGSEREGDGAPSVVTKTKDTKTKRAEVKIPKRDFDVLVTNPPFSGDHAKVLAGYLVGLPKQTPWAVLLPEYVHRKTWWAPLTKKHPQMLFVVPKKRYAFVAKSGGRLANAGRTLCRHFSRDGSCPKGDGCAFVHRGTWGGGGGINCQPKYPRDDGGGSGKRSEEINDDGSARNETETSRSEIVAPFDVVWHVHCGECASQSVAAAWRQKFSGRKSGGPGTGARLVVGIDALEEMLRSG